MWQGYQEVNKNYYYFLKMEYFELDHFLRNPQRRADIKEAEYVNFEEFDPLQCDPPQ